MEPRTLVLALVGGSILVVALVLLAIGHDFDWVGRLPGDLRIEGEDGPTFIPLTSTLILFGFLALLFFLFRRLF